MKFNDDRERVQINRYKEVPIEGNKNLWFFWYCKNLDWDSELITRPQNIITALEEKDSPNQIDKIFCVWHGQNRTNIFLMDIKDLKDRLTKIILSKSK